VNAVPPGANFYIMAGTIEKFYKGMLVGAIGGVLSIANYLPELCCQLQEAYEAGNLAEAQRLDLYARTISKKCRR